MRQAWIFGVIATVIFAAALLIGRSLDQDGDDVPGARPNGSEIMLRYTVEPAEDSWVNGARSYGADDRMLSDAESSVCFLTKVEVAGFQGPDDTGACRVEVDEFTGFWKVTADVPEGSSAEIRCNARCLTWE